MNPNTARAYSRIARDFAEYLDMVQVSSFDGITNETVTRFLTRYNNRPTSYNLALSAILYVLRACEDEGYIVENLQRIEKRIKRKKRGKPIKLFLSKHQLLKARDNAYILFPERHIRERNLLIFDLAMYSMFRCDELAQIRLGDIDIEQQRLAVRGKGGASDLSGNRAVTGSIPLPKCLIDQIVQYVNDYRIQCANEPHRPRYTVPGSIIPDAPLFTTRKRTGISTSCINRVASAFISSLFPDKSLMPANHGIHCIRRSMATHRMKRGVDITTIQRMLRHKSIETTIQYLDVERETIDKGFIEE